MDASRYIYDIGPKKVPTSPTTEISFDCRILRIRLGNNTGAPITVNITDSQGTPISIIPQNYIINPGGFLIYVNEKWGDLSPGGVIWSASAPNLDGYIQAAAQ